MSLTYLSKFDPFENHQIALSMASRCRDVMSLEIAPVDFRSNQMNDEIIKMITWFWPNLQALSFGGRKTSSMSLLAIAINCQQLRVLEVAYSNQISSKIFHLAIMNGFRSKLHLIFIFT